jgi:hypothetical protein
MIKKAGIISPIIDQINASKTDKFKTSKAKGMENLNSVTGNMAKRTVANCGGKL